MLRSQLPSPNYLSAHPSPSTLTSHASLFNGDVNAQLEEIVVRIERRIYVTIGAHKGAAVTSCLTTNRFGPAEYERMYFRSDHRAHFEAGQTT